MFPSDNHSISSSTVSKKPDIFKTSWQKEGLGTKKRLYLVYDDIEKSVRARIDEQNVLKQFINIIRNGLKSKNQIIPPEKKFKIGREKKFTNISNKKFQKEKQNLELLIAKHASIKELLAQIEKDFSLHSPAEKTPKIENNSAASLTENLKKISQTPLDIAVQPLIENPPSPSKDLPETNEGLLNETEKEASENSREISDQPLNETAKELEEQPEREPAAENLQMTNDQVSSEESFVDIDLEETKEKETLLKNPSLAQEEILERQKTIENLRSQLKTLLEKIQKQQNNPNLHSYAQLKASVKHIKAIAQSAFSKLVQLEEDASNPQVSSTELLEAVKEIESNHVLWNQEMASIRKTLVEESSLQKEIDAFTLQIKHFSSTIKSKWQELITKWKDYTAPKLSSLAEVQEHKQEISKMVEDICIQCKQELMETINNSVESLKENLENSPLNVPEEHKKAAHQNYKEQVLTIRKKAWHELGKTLENLGSDLNELVQAHQLIIKEQAADHALLKALNLPRQEKNLLAKLYSSLPSIPSFSSKKTLPLVQEKELLDEAAILYITHALQKIKETASCLFKSIPLSTFDEEKLNQQYSKIFNNQTSMKSDLDTFIDDLIFASQNTINAEDSELHGSLMSMAADLQAQKAALSILLAAHEHHTSLLIENLKTSHVKIFSPNMHDSLSDYAQTLDKQLNPNKKTDLDFLSLSTTWQNVRKLALAGIEKLKQLDEIATLYSEYDTIALTLEKEIKNLTGKEKEKAKISLAELRKAIDSVEALTKKIKIHPADIFSYQKTLQKANGSFAYFFNIEEKKKELRAALNKEIDQLPLIINGFYSQIEQIEKFYSVEMSETRNYLKTKERFIQELKQKEYNPDSFLIDLDIEDLTIPQLSANMERVKLEITLQKTELADICIPEAVQSIKTFQAEAKELENYIKNLTQLSTTQKFSEDQDLDNEDSEDEDYEFSIPKRTPIKKNKAEKNEYDLQFLNAALSTKKLKALKEKQRKSITLSPQPKFIIQRLKNDSTALNKILSESKKTTNQSLLIQIKDLNGFPLEQKAAKLAFVKTLNDKMADHTQQMTKEAKSFTFIPELHHEVVHLIAKTKVELSANLKKTHQTLQSHAEHWQPILPIKNSTQSFFPPRELLDIEAVSHSDLHHYNQQIELAFNHGKNQIKRLRETYDKAILASKKFDEKLKEAYKLKKTLTEKNQIINSKDLEETIKSVKTEKEKYDPSSIAKEIPQKTNGWFPCCKSKKSIKKPEPALVILEDYKKHVGNCIEKLEAKRKKCEKIDHLTIPEQLALNPDREIVQELRERFDAQNKPLIDEAREKLESYKNKISTIHSVYVPQTSELYKEIENSINEKLKTLNQYEKNYQTTVPGTLITFYRNKQVEIPIAELNPQQMEAYSKHLAKIQTSVKDSLNETYHIDHMAKEQAAYEKQTILAKKHATKLREKGHFSNAYDFEKEIGAITAEEAKWRGKVTKVTQIVKIIKDFEDYSKRMVEVIEKYNSDKAPLLLIEQMRLLLNIPQNSDVEKDLKKIKKLMDFKIERDNKIYKNNLKKLKTDIEEIFSIYNIKITPIKNVIEFVNTHIEEFTRNQTLFAQPLSWFFSFFISPSFKTIDEMTPQEILKIDPEKIAQNSIKKSIEEISKFFNHQPILTAHLSYKESLENAEKIKKALIEKGQIYHAASLHDEIDKITSKYKEEVKKPVKNELQFEDLIEKLEKYAASLQNEGNAAKQKTFLSSKAQVRHLAPNSSFRPKLVDSLTKDLQTTISKQNTLIKQYTDDVNKLVKIMGFPKAWKKTIIHELNACQKKIETAGTSLPEESRILFFKKTTHKPLSTPSVNELLIVETNLKNEIETLGKVAAQYNLNSVNNQFKAYEKQLVNIQTLKNKWTKELQIDYADQLEVLEDNNYVKVKAHFEKKAKEKLPLNEEMKILPDFIKKFTTELKNDVEKIKINKPKTLGSLLQEIDENKNPVKYRDTRLALQSTAVSKLEVQQLELINYVKKIDSIDELLQKIDKDHFGIPGEWKDAVAEKINLKLEQLKKLMEGLPTISANGVTWKPIEKLNKAELLQYESLVDQLVEKEKDVKNQPNSMIQQLENQLHLTTIEQHLEWIEGLVSALETAIIKHTLHNQTKQTLERIIIANKKILLKSVDHLKIIPDATYFQQTLLQIQAVLARAYDQKKGNLEIDPWSRIHINEKENNQEKTSTELEVNRSFELITEENFCVSYSFKGKVVQETCTAFNKLSDVEISNLKKQKTELEKEFQLLHNSGLNKESSTSKTIQKYIEKIGPLINDIEKFCETLPSKKFEELLNHKVSLTNLISRPYASIHEITNDGPIYWKKQIDLALQKTIVGDSLEKQEKELKETQEIEEFGEELEFVEEQKAEEPKLEELIKEIPLPEPVNIPQPHFDLHPKVQPSNKPIEPEFKILEGFYKIINDFIGIMSKAIHEKKGKPTFMYELKNVNYAQLEEMMNKAFPNEKDLNSAYSTYKENIDLFLELLESTKDKFSEQITKIKKQNEESIKKIEGLKFDLSKIIEKDKPKFAEICQTWKNNLTYKTQCPKFLEISKEKRSPYDYKNYVEKFSKKLKRKNKIQDKQNTIDKLITPSHQILVDILKIKSFVDKNGGSDISNEDIDNLGNKLIEFTTQDSINHSDLDSEIHTFAKECKEILETIPFFEARNTIIQEIGTENQKIKEEITKINEICDVKFSHIETKLEELQSNLTKNAKKCKNSQELENYKTTIINKLKSFSKAIALQEAIKATENYSDQCKKIENFIQELYTSDQYLTAHKLKSILNHTKSEIKKYFAALNPENFFDFSEKIMEYTNDLDEKLLNIVNEETPVTNLRKQISKLSVNGKEEIELLKVKTTKRLKEFKDNIISAARELNNFISQTTSLNIDLKRQLQKESETLVSTTLSQVSDMANLSTENLPKYIEITLPNLEKNLIRTNSLKEVVETWIEISNDPFKNWKAKNNDKKIKKHHPFFAIDKMAIFYEKVKKSAQKNNLNQFIKDALEFKTEFTKLEAIFQKSNDLPIDKSNLFNMNFIQQLEANDKENILTKESKEKILEKIKKAGQEAIHEAIKLIKKYGEKTESFSSTLKKITSLCIDKKIEALYEINQIDLKKSTLTEIKDWILNFKKSARETLPNLTKILKLEDHVKDYKNYQDLLEDIKSAASHFYHKNEMTKRDDLVKIRKNIESQNEKMLEKLSLEPLNSESFDEYWKSFNLLYAELENALKKSGWKKPQVEDFD